MLTLNAWRSLQCFNEGVIKPPWSSQMSRADHLSLKASIQKFSQKLSLRVFHRHILYHDLHWHTSRKVFSTEMFVLKTWYGMQSETNWPCLYVLFGIRWKGVNKQRVVLTSQVWSVYWKQYGSSGEPCCPPVPVVRNWNEKRNLELFSACCACSANILFEKQKQNI